MKSKAFQHQVLKVNICGVCFYHYLLCPLPQRVLHAERFEYPLPHDSFNDELKKTQNILFFINKKVIYLQFSAKVSAQTLKSSVFVVVDCYSHCGIL